MTDHFWRNPVSKKNFPSWVRTRGEEGGGDGGEEGKGEGRERITKGGRAQRDGGEGMKKGE